MKKILFAAVALLMFLPASLRGADLSKYVIVYSAAAEDEEGLDIAQAVRDAVGLDLKAVTDETAPAKFEILIGKTNRKESAAFYDASPDTFDWSLSRKGGKILVQGGGCWALARAASKLSGGVPSKPLKGNIYGEFLFPREDGSNLRILDDNIWDYGKPANSPHWEGSGYDCRDEVRVRALQEVVWATLPDIISLQEYSHHMDGLFRAALEEKGYKIAFLPAKEDWNHTPVFYREDALELISCKYYRYEPKAWSNRGSKSYTAAHFRHKATGKEFLVLNTHLWWKSEKSQAGSDYARAAQVRRMMVEADDFILRNNAPVFMMGDMNCRFSSDAMKQLLAAGYKPVWDIATVFGDRRGGHHYCFADGFSRASTTKDNGQDSIDQFFLYNGGDTEIKSFHRIYAWFLVPVTDHYPNYADIRL